MKLFSIFFISAFLLTSQLIATETIEQDSNISIKIFNIDNEQELYNSIKRVFYTSQHEHILDTNWTSLHMSKRVITGFIDIDVEVQNVVLSSKTLDKNGTKELSLEIYSTQNDEVTSFKPDSFLHSLFWNRLEFILGLEDEWINCNLNLKTMLSHNHMLCNADKDKARPKDTELKEETKEREPQ
ncbi:hypothetical protein M947_10715 [Sulfurimonas hongkongensis]|uniref:Lipid/polyisoprenoid-binding YceI-like domain-containing protein n=1 Tax=Sulfurimonas hongkongensis TaxID=1172190 RepID=T0J085_9BACT|nr:hypothetical protein [Sulfurimonas hongkongensis]EQB34470.1 hypothetical protein M947_10715 [Sulfurimonas hongkongensis]